MLTVLDSDVVLGPRRRPPVKGVLMKDILAVGWSSVGSVCTKDSVRCALYELQWKQHNPFVKYRVSTLPVAPNTPPPVVAIIRSDEEYHARS